MRTFCTVAVLTTCGLVSGCTPPPTVTEGQFTDRFRLTMQRGSTDLIVQTSGPAKYKVTNYSMDHPMGRRPDTEATFTTPAGTFVVSDKGQTEAGFAINGTFYPEPPPGQGRSTITIDPQGHITVQPAPADPLRENKPETVPERPTTKK